jgi:flagellar motility protein MotE (MotC chaperone)/sporulation protein YlmC with PRC-barrel domain
MNTIAANRSAVASPTPIEQTFFLSELLGAKVMVNGKRIGRLTDVAIKKNGAVPLVTHMCVSLPFGESAVVPWDKVGALRPTEKQVDLAIESIAPFRGEPEEDAVLLKDHILDKKAIDLEGRELEVVYDVRLAIRNHKLYVTDVDLSRYGLLRRMGLTGLANFVYNLADSIRDQTVSWKYIMPLPSKIGRFQGDVQLSVLKEKLNEMHPVDLADILEEMDPEQRVEIFERLDPEQASDTLEEIDPNAQRDLVESLKIEKVAQLIDEMTTGQAADVLSVLSASEADAILERLNKENARKIRAIMEQHEQNILNFATQEFIAYPPDMTAEQAQDAYRLAAKGKDVVMYVYILDADRRLLGVMDIKELLQADDKARLKDVMVDSIVSLDRDSTLKKASELFARYEFRALPILDEERRMLGVVTYRDVMGLKHRYVE